MGELPSEGSGHGDAEQASVLRYDKVVPIFVGDVLGGYPQATSEEERLLCLRDTAPGTLRDLGSAFYRLANRALMGDVEAIQTVDTILPSIRAMALLSGVEPPREQPASEQERKEWMKRASELTEERQRNSPASRQSVQRKARRPIFGPNGERLLIKSE